MKGLHILSESSFKGILQQNIEKLNEWFQRDCQAHSTLPSLKFFIGTVMHGAESSGNEYYKQGFGRENRMRWESIGWESHRFMFAFYCIFFCKRLPLMFQPSYQNGGKILSIDEPPVGRRWLVE